MNKTRRKAIEKVAAQLIAIPSVVEGLSADEMDCFENLPESLQSSERGEIMEETAQELEEIAFELENIYQRLEEIINQ